jgi:nucleoside 2-deoxyribosyltransferase
VISAHVREEWGSRLDSPATALKTDLRDLISADAIVAYIGHPASPGVQFELGVATAFGVPTIVVLDKDRPSPYLTPALTAVSGADIVEIEQDSTSHDRIVRAVNDSFAT